MEFLRFIYSHRRGYKIPSEEEIYPLVAISDFLITQGFVFCRASTADGISEIMHTGVAPYTVVYRDLDNFRNNFVQDFFAAQKRECASSGGWISSLDYGHVDVYLKKENLLFHASVNGGTVVEWYGYADRDKVLIDLADDAMQHILTACSRVERQAHQLTQPLPNYWDSH